MGRKNKIPVQVTGVFVNRAVAGIFIFVLACFSNSSAYAQGTKTVSFYIQAPADLVSVSHGGQVGIALFPKNIPSMAGTPVASTLLLTARVRDANGELCGISSELEVFPAGPVTAETVWDTYWTVVIPGRGTLYGHHQEHLSREISRIIKSVHETGQGWSGEITSRNTVGPLPGNRGLILAGTGEFEHAAGWFLETGTLRGYTSAGVMSAQLELRFTLTDNPKD